MLVVVSRCAAEIGRAPLLTFSPNLLPRKLSGWTRLNAGLQISKLLARNQSSTRASQQLGQELKNLASPTPGTQADDVD